MVGELADLRGVGLPRLGTGAGDVLGHRTPDGMLRGRLQRAGEPDRLGVVRHHLVHAHPAGGDGAGLVEHHRVDPPGLLEDAGVADHHAELRRAAGAHQQRGRGREPQGAGTGDDQHGHRGDEAARRVAEQRPDGEREGRQRQDDRHEHGGHPVGQPLHGRLGGLGVPDQLRDPGDRGVPADACHLDDQPPRRVERRAGDLVAGLLVDGDALAGEHRLVDTRAAVEDHPVGGHLLAGPDQEPHPGTQQGDVDQPLGPVVVEQGRLLGAELEQLAQGRAGALPGPRLRPPAEQQEGGDGRGHLDVGVHPAGDRLYDRPAVGDQGAQGDEGVHGAGAVPGVDRRGPVERPAGPQHHGRREQQGGPAHERGVGDARRHRQHEHQQGERGRDEQPAPVVVGQALLLATGRRRGVLRGHRRGVAGALDRADQQVDVHRARRVVDRRRGRRQVDGRAHPVEPVELLLHPADAGRAGHPADEQVDVGRVRAGARARRLS